MKTSKYLLLLVLSFITIASCNNKKKYETSVSGYVTEKYGDRKIAGAKVYLAELHFGTYTTNAAFVDSAETDTNGYYKMTGNLRGKDYVIFASAKNYNPQNDRYNDVENLKDITSGKDKACNVELWPHAWLKIRFVNQSGADELYVNPIAGTSFGFQISEPDVTVDATTRANDTTTIACFKYTDGNRGSFQEKVYCPGLDTTYTEIFY